MHAPLNQQSKSQGRESNSPAGSPLEDELQQSRSQIQHIQQQIKQDHKIIKETKKVYVGTPFTYDLTEFFKFERPQYLHPGGKIGSIFYQISGGGLSWIILAYSLVNASFMCVWVFVSRSNNFLVLIWRYFFQALLMIPFVLHEKRTISFQNSHKYSLSYIFKPINLKKLYLSSIATAIWYGTIITAGQWTYLSHALYLGSLTNFFLSLARHKGKHCHQYQIGGQVVIIVGIFFVLLDTIYFRYEEISPAQLSKKNNFYLNHSYKQRLLADIIALLTSLVISRFSFINSGMHHIFPPYLSMMIIDFMNSANMLIIGYFFNGLTFDFADEWGLFSIFTNYQFTIFLYGGIILSIGIIITYSLISRLFPNFVAPGIAFFFQPAITTLFLNFFDYQALPRSFSLIGYTIMTPGMILILIGQWIFLRDKKKHELLQKIKLTQLEQMIHQKQLQKGLISSAIHTNELNQNTLGSDYLIKKQSLPQKKEKDQNNV